MLAALDQYVVGGIRTNVGLFRRILEEDGFRSAAIDTGYLERLLAQPAPVHESRVPPEIAALAAAYFSSVAKPRAAAATTAAESAWLIAGRREALR
jgi:acetyl-CoA carboxylase biotin carboxylase subunit